MDRIHYDLEPGEIALLSDSSVKRGNRGSYGNELVLTTRNLVFVELGMFGGVKQIIVYPLDIISKAAVGVTKNGDKQLQIVYGNEMGTFDFGYEDEIKNRLWSMAITNQISEFSSYFDASYYDRFSKDNLKKVSRQISEGEITEEDVTFDLSSLGDIAGAFLKSGNFSTKGLQKALSKGKKKNNAGGGFLKGLRDEFGITDIQNEFLDMFGMETEETNDEREKRMLEAAFDYVVYQSRMELAAIQQQEAARAAQSHVAAQAAAKSVDGQIEAVKKLKELLDAGILTQEEFDKKKKEVMNL